jgi:hypothetical protein
MSGPDFNRRLKDAVKSESAPPHIHARIRSHLREPAPGGFWAVPVALAGALCGSLLIFYSLGGLRLTTGARESYIASVSARVSGLMRIGLGDHIHCAIFHRPKTPPSAEKIEESLGPQYGPLVPVVRRYVPDQYHLLIAHQCDYHGRRFVHLAFADDFHLLSLVIADKREGESFEVQRILPALVQSGIPLYQAAAQRFALDAFETRGRLVYLISDLPLRENSKMMAALATPVKALLEAPPGW